MSLMFGIILVVLGVIGAGYFFHRWKSQTDAVVEEVASKVNTVIDKVKSSKK